MTSATSLRLLPLRPIDRCGFAPYGWLIDAGSAYSSGCDATAVPSVRLQPINDGSSLRIDGLSPLTLTGTGGEPGLALFRAAARDPAGPSHGLERHRHGSQTFIPLTGARSVVLVARGGDVPDESTLAAFLVSGQQGFTIAAGVWHHGLIALDAGDFVVIERLVEPPDCDLAALRQAVVLELAKT